MKLWSRSLCHFLLLCAFAGCKSAARRPFKTTRQTAPFAINDYFHMSSALDCGRMCSYIVEPPASKKTGTRVAILPRSFQCTTAWVRLLSTCPADQWPPPKDVPTSMRDEFTMHGQMEVKEWYWSTRYGGKENDYKSLWTNASLLQARIDAPTIREAVNGVFSYSTREVMYVGDILNEFKHAIEGQTGVVWGSEMPWLEILLARAGSRRTVTIDYGKLDSIHPAVMTVSPQQFAASMLTRPRAFDFAFTYSSLEHSGLGRYGDSLNPVGDIEAAAQTWCLLRPGGYFFLGLPAADPDASADVLVWNAHRFYGPKRLAQMFAGFEHVKTFDTRPYGNVPQERRMVLPIYQNSIVHVLRKPMPA